MNRPIALTCGDPAGVGLEISVKAWRALGNSCPFFLIADRRHLPVGVFTEITHPDQTLKAIASGLPLLHHDFPEPATAGQLTLKNSQSVIDVIIRAHGLVKTGAASAICTNPINKQALQEGAGFAYPGHTEFLAALAGVDLSVMMLTAPELRVVPVTIHIAIKDVPEALTPALLERTLTITHAALQHDFGIAAPRIMVAGLNPHAGEGGAMGLEDMDMIAPVLNKMRAHGMDIEGPAPADTMFHAGMRERYDVAVCMYHDQALIPLKTLNFSNGTNVTLGLDFIRTSPDHGTALNIAGQNKADANSLIAALKQAAEMVQAREALS